MSTDVKTFYKHVSHYLTGNVCAVLLGFISFPLLTRLLSVEEYGELNLISSTALLFIALSKVGMQNSVVRFYNQAALSREPFALPRYYSSLLLGAFSTTSLVCVAYAAGIWLLPPSLLENSLKLTLLLGLGLILIRPLQSLVLAFLQAQGKTRFYATFQIATKAGTILAICVLLFTWNKAIPACMAGTFAVEGAGIAIVSYDLFQNGLIGTSYFDFGIFREAALFGLPLVGYEIAGSILDSGDRFLVQHFLGARQLGYYAAAYGVAAYVPELLTVPVRLAVIPMYMKIWTEKGREATQEFLARCLHNYVALAAGLVCIVTVTSGDILTFFASRKYQEAHRLLPVLLTGIMIYTVNILLSAGLVIWKKTVSMLMQIFYAAVSNILLNLILIPWIGLMGAAVATMLSYMLFIFLMARASFAVLPLRLNYPAFARYVFAALVAGVCVSQVKISILFLRLATKGLLSLVLYGLILFAIDREIRRLVIDSVGGGLLRTVGLLGSSYPTP